MMFHCSVKKKHACLVFDQNEKTCFLALNIIVAVGFLWIVFTRLIKFSSISSLWTMILKNHKSVLDFVKCFCWTIDMIM